MKFSVGAVLAFAAAALAKPVLLNSNYLITEGEPFTLKWNNAEGPVTVTLMTGSDPNNLKKVTDLTTGQTGTEYTFTLNDLPSGKYAIRITDGSAEPNYSPQFNYVGTGVLPSSSSTSLSATPSSTSASVSSTSASSTSSTSSASSSTTSSVSSTSSTLSTSTTSTSSTSTRQPAATTAPVNTNNGQRFASPLALIAVTVAALVFFN
ncbi:hypothetical protein C8A05DRAFT_29170 [Staphylotrichum tortipilum]|uniref:Extracellular matrix protein n=1 Tax=Staphylotrichum tortipilum TaxID=2831512 RepID=A0AAN6RYN1_9PEZI|nr:hypothetical protein C8A05DRAFT_29170 [Staphylotrichum longicolle]